MNVSKALGTYDKGSLGVLFRPWPLDQGMFDKVCRHGGCHNGGLQLASWGWKLGMLLNTLQRTEWPLQLRVTRPPCLQCGGWDPRT